MKKFIKIIIIIIVLIILTLLYARLFGIKGLKVKEYKINTNISNEYHGLKIVQIADVHYGSTVFENELKVIIDKVNLLKPDIVVLTGDLIDEKNSYDKDILIKYLSMIDVTIDKYAVSGNHDIIEDYNYILNNSGFTNLDDKYTLVYKSKQPIIISGISTSLFENDITNKTIEFDNYYSELPDEEKPIYSILLTHEPDNVKKINIDNYDLVISGHSHGCQINIPLVCKLGLPEGAKEYYHEHYTINNTELYISSGIGTSGLKMRLFSKPSISLYRITNN